MKTKGIGLLRDLSGLAILALIALAAGALINSLRVQPLPWRYLAPEQRLTQEIERLGGTDLSQHAPAPVLTLDEVQSARHRPDVILLDARAEGFYQISHLPGAHPLSRIGFTHDFLLLKPQLDTWRGKQFIVYCSDKDCHDSEWVAKALIHLGFSRVATFKGGFAVWKKAGLPLESGQ